jgi:glucose-6-phosphate dehydrogenase assembly protein OpcA
VTAVASTSAPASGDFLSGIPVPVDPAKIDRELAKLWKPEGGGSREAATRAAISNLVVYLPDPAERSRAMEVLRRVGRRFPSRIIVLTRGAATRKPEEPLRAWLNAICHLPAPGAPPVCCEEITLEAGGRDLEVFPGAVLALLTPDVPVIFTAPAPAGEPLARLLAGAAGRVVFDSRAAGRAGLEAADRFLRERPGVLGDDLAWRDTAAWRRTICDLFDEPRARELLASLSRVEVSYEVPRAASAGADGSGPAAGASLIAGWLVSRLRRRLAVSWRAVAREPAGAAPAGREASSHIASVLLASGSGDGSSFVKVAREEEGGHFRIEHCTEAACVLPRLVPSRAEDEAELLGAAVERTTHQRVFREALAAAAKLA